MRTRTIRNRNIGITGLTSNTEIKAISTTFKCLCQQKMSRKYVDIPPRLLLGILASPNSLLHTKPASKRSHYPSRETFQTLFEEETTEGLKICHFSTHKEVDLVYSCDEIVELADGRLDGFQFNLCWPDPYLIELIRKRHPNLYLILQIGEKALDRYRVLKDYPIGPYNVLLWDQIEFVQKIEQYANIIDSILIDPSGGKGVLVDTNQYKHLIRVIMNEFDGLEISLAGGLSAETIDTVGPALEICPYLGVDAEKLLRNQDDNTLSIHKSIDYLVQTFNFFGY